MKKTRIIACLLAMTMTASLMTACGSKKVDTASETQETTETKTVAATVSLNDTKTGITVKGKADATALAVSEIDSDVNDSVKDLVGKDLDTEVTALATYDISIANADDKNVQPDSTVTVTIPLSDALTSADGDTYAVYYFNPDDNSVENMNGSASEDSVSFKTTHFSVYSVVKFADPANEPEEETVEETEETEKTSDAKTKETKNKSSAKTDDTKTETPAVAETPTVTETPAATETPAVTEAPASTETQTVAETPVQETTTASNRYEESVQEVLKKYPDIPESIMPRTAPTEWDAEHAYSVIDEPVLLYTWYDCVSRNVYSDFNQTQVVASFAYPEVDCTDILWIVDYDNSCAHAIGIYNGQYVTWNQAMAFCTYPEPYDR